MFGHLDFKYPQTAVCITKEQSRYIRWFFYYCLFNFQKICTNSTITIKKRNFKYLNIEIRRGDISIKTWIRKCYFLFIHIFDLNFSWIIISTDGVLLEYFFSSWCPLVLKIHNQWSFVINSNTYVVYVI